MDWIGLDKISKKLIYNIGTTHNNHMSMEQEEQYEYERIINEMYPSKTIRTGSLTYYFKRFLLNLYYDEWWSQPQAQAFCNTNVLSDGGVDWNTRNGGKKNPDGTPSSFGDPGRALEKHRTEKYDDCWDNKTGKNDGPFRLNIDKYKQFKGSTKCHSFSDQDKKRVLLSAAGKCELCGYKGKLEVDHFMPKEKGGESCISNGNALCSRCNDRKCNKDPLRFIKEEFDRTLIYSLKLSPKELAEMKEYVLTRMSIFYSNNSLMESAI